MRKAIQVMATLVAFLLSGQAFAIKVYPTMPLVKDVVGGTATIVGDGVKFTGSIFSGEFIPAPVSAALAVVPETSIASSAISGLAKKAVLGGMSLGAGLIVGYAADELLKGVDFILANGVVTKAGTAATTPVTVVDPASGNYFYANGWSSGFLSSGQGSCEAGAEAWAGLSQIPMTSASFAVTNANNGSGVCTWTSQGATSVVTNTFPVQRYGSSCPAGTAYDSGTTYCLPTGQQVGVPVVAADLSVLDGFVKGKDGTWQRDLATELCGGLESCYQSMSPTSQLGGPSTVTGKPQTITTTSPGGSPSVTVKTPSATITYGPNWYDYNPVTTTTSPDGTTTINDSPSSIPVPPSILPPGNDGLKGINDGIPGTTSTSSPIPYMAWYSFSQNCSEITLIIPVYGGFQTALCPIYARYIWPTLYFFFAVFTWIHCWSIWRNTVLRVRAS